MRAGIDIGSISVKSAVLNQDGIVKVSDLPHHGEIENAVNLLKSELSHFPLKEVGITGRFEEKTFPDLNIVHPVNAQIKGSLYMLGDVRNIIDAGGSTATLIILNEKGELSKYKINSVCAAGTGAFLEHQAKRLEISPEEMGKRCYTACPPSIATRCAVFAKTDIISRQQEGYRMEELWHGLCKSVAETLLSTLLKGMELEGKTLLIGGLSRNQLFVKWLKEYIQDIYVSELSPFAGAIGASFFALKENIKFLERRDFVKRADRLKRRSTLLIKDSRIMESPSQINFIDKHGTEIKVCRDGYKGKVWLGIDIGSTSTKICAISEDKEVLFHLYRKTKGDPVSATRFLFEAKKEVNKFLGYHEIVGIGTTGSGRKMIGKLLKADIILNEITAHATGARFQCDGVETIFEIGGQDSKYIHLKNGVVDHINMNYVCAAGTGSFIEELADLLGYRVQDVGEIVLGVEPPFTSERCTVFMEQDALNLLRKGFLRREVMAGVIYSVALNYISRVVGKRPITGDFVFFQGATARNKGLLASFESILQKKLFTTDLCHVNGALGVALQCMERNSERKATNSVSVLFDSIERREKECPLCSNRCKITSIKTLEEEASWGYMCGREADENRKREIKEYKAFEDRNKLLSGFIKQEGRLQENIGLPLSLSTHVLMPFYVKLLNELGYRVIFSGQTNDDVIKKGDLASTSDFCLPVKVAMGHIAKLLERDVKKIFLPYLIRAFPRMKFSNTYFCPYVQAIAGIFSSFVRTKNLAVDILSPVIDFTLSHEINIKNLLKVFLKEGLYYSEVKRAYGNALEHQREFSKRLEETGERITEEMGMSNVPTICIVGRNYTIYDQRVSLRIPLLFATYGVNVIPGEFLRFSEKNFPPGFENMFWFSGQNILNTVIVSLKNSFYPVVISHFSCGPDSFILSYLEMLCGESPYLIFELDEHSSETGFLTRIEAFLNVISARKPLRGANFYIKIEGKTDERKILIPNTHPVGDHLFTAVFRKYGYDAESLPPSNKIGFELGRKVTRGSDCLPMAVTFGNLLEFIKEKGYEPRKLALFMPTSNGPCRFGQYAPMQKTLLEKMGLSEMSIITPSAANSYLGLPNSLRKDLSKAIIAGDVLFKLRCKFKPREKEKGLTEEITASCIKRGIEIFEKNADLFLFLEHVKSRFERIELDLNKRVPLVGVVGEIFVRCNLFSNDYLLEAIEKYGGEMWLAPASEWLFFVSFTHLWESKERNRYLEVLKNRLKNKFLKKIEDKAYETVKDLLGDRKEPEIEEVVREALLFLPKEHTTEAFITIGRAIKFIKRDGVSLVINVAPFTCMPGNISSSIFLEIEKKFDVPIISIFYDGDEGQNERVGVYLKRFVNY